MHMESWKIISYLVKQYQGTETAKIDHENSFCVISPVSFCMLY